MQWIAPQEKDLANETLEKRLWAAADQFRADFVLANGSMSSNQSGEGDIDSPMTSRKLVSFCRRNQTTILEVAA